jgi:hypothetical protein
MFLTGVLEKRLGIKFFYKLGKTPTETYEVLQTVCADEVICRSNVSEGFK